LASGDRRSDEVQVIAGDSVFELVPKLVSGLSRSLDCCIDAKSVPSMIPALPDLARAKNSGASLRCITEITEDSLPYSRELMKYFDLYHVPLLAGTFVIIDKKDYLGYAEEKGEPGIIHISIPSFLKSQTFLFDSLIENAIPAKQRIAEIRKGGEAEFMETIRDPGQIKALLLGLLNSAIYEVSILFSSRSLLFLAEREGILDVLASLSANGIRIRMLVMEDSASAPTDELTVASDIRLNYLQQFLPSRITTVIVDESKSLVMEIADATKCTFQEAIGLATYSNSESTVFSNTSMFESLWIQSELDKQNKIRQVYFQMFKGFKMKDEVYSRRWSFEREKQDDK
jgi:hypothetical protein